MIKLNNVEIIPTQFPDKTKQVWNLSKSLFSPYSLITWDYENDGELITLAQLVSLLRKEGVSVIHLEMPYLPYARQDKDITNETSFGLYVFATLLNTLELDLVTFIDAHSKIATKLINNSQNIPPAHILDEILNSDKYDLIVYPDLGASERYPSSTIPSWFAYKRREKNGNIYTLKLMGGSTKGNKVLVVDDIVDGGATFLKLLPLIKEKIPNAEVHLVISHHIQKSAIDKLKEAGYNTIRDKNGYL